MKYLFILSICLFYCACAPAVHKNTTFFRTHSLDARLHNALADAQIGDTLVIAGMTSTMQIAGDYCPVIHFLAANNQLAFVPVDSIPIAKAENILLTGIVHQNAELLFPTLFPINVEKKGSFLHFILKAQQYSEKAEINFPLQKNTEWIAFEYNQLVIVFKQSADIMNAYHLDFIFNQEKLTDVYFEKRFKGE